MRKGLVALLFTSAVYAGDFQEELKLLENRVKAYAHDNCETKVTIRQLIDEDVKKVYQRNWVNKIEGVNKFVHDYYASQFGICLDIVDIEQWNPAESDMAALAVDVRFREPKGIHVLLALTGKQSDDDIPGSGFLNGNHAVSRMTKNEKGYVLIHELGHLFGATDIENPNSVMHFEYSPSLDWDEQNKQTVLKNKNRSWALYDYEKGLYEVLESLKNPRAKQKLRDVAILDDNNEEGKAARKLEKLVKQYPQEKFLQYYLGRLYEKSNQEEKATKAYERAYALGADYAVLLNNVAYSYLARETDKEKALAFAQRAVQKYPTDESYRDTLGWAYYHNGLYAEAEKELLQIIENKENTEYLYHLGMTYDKLQKYDPAKEIFTKLAGNEITLKLRILAQKKLKEYELQKR